MSAVAGKRKPRRGSSLGRDSVTALVREGWNALSTTYGPPRERKDWFSHDEAEYRGWLQPLMTELREGIGVLDLGCGTGLPADRIMASRFQVTGVDLSDVMIRRARRAVPGARFLRANMTEVDFPAESFGAVTSLYAIIHVPLQEQRALLSRIQAWLRPRGLFLAILGHGAYEGTEEGWLGSNVPMFWSHADAATYRSWLKTAGFSILNQQFIPEGDSGHELFLAQKASGG